MKTCALGVGFGVACWLLLAPFALAQPEKDKPEADLTAPGEEHKQLDALAGTWDVAVKFQAGPGREGKGTATCAAKWVLGDRFLQQEYQSNFMGKPFTVLQYLGYDRHKKKVLEIHMDSLDTGMLHNEGSISKDGKTITCVGERIDPASGRASKMRSVTTVTDKDHYTLEWFVTGDDGKEEKAVSLTHTRKKP